MTKPREIIMRIECGTGADITDEDAYWVETGATDDEPAAITVLVYKGTPLAVAATLLGMAEDVVLSEAIDEDPDEQDEADAHIAN